MVGGNGGSRYHRKAAHAAVDAGHLRLVVADQSELIPAICWDASGERKKTGFQLELPTFAGGPAISRPSGRALGHGLCRDTLPYRRGPQA